MECAMIPYRGGGSVSIPSLECQSPSPGGLGFVCIQMASIPPSRGSGRSLAAHCGGGRWGDRWGCSRVDEGVAKVVVDVHGIVTQVRLHSASNLARREQ